MNKKNFLGLIVALLLVGSMFGAFRPLKSQVTVSFLIKDVWWGTYNTKITPAPGDENVPLTLEIQQRSSYYLRGIIGYVFLPSGFRDADDNDNVTQGDGVAIETDNDAGDVIPYGSFYITVYVDLNESLTVGTYTMQINITYAANIGNGTFEFGYTNPPLTFEIELPNQAPEVTKQDPSGNTVTVNVFDNQTFMVEARDPNGDNITFKWYLDDVEIPLENITSMSYIVNGRKYYNSSYTYIAGRNDRGSHTLEVKISDGTDTVTVTWTINVPNRAPEVKEQNPTDTTVTIYVGDNRTFSVLAEDPDNDSITYTWYFDGDKVLSGPNATNYTYFAVHDDVGGHTLRVEISDDEDTTTVTWNINVDIVSKTNVTPNADYVYAGKKIVVVVNITNNLWQGTVEVDISYPDYIAFFSQTHWTFRNVKPGQTISMPLHMYVPASVLTSFGEVELIGQTLDITFDLSFTDEFGRSHSESHSAEFIIRGSIQLKFFGVSAGPENLTAGGIGQVSLTILNVGVATALYSNATIMENQYVERIAESFYYIGDIEPGSPLPVILKFKVNDTVKPGTYNLTVVIFYYDDIYIEHTIYLNVSFVVHEKTSETEEENVQPTVSYSIALYILGLVIAAAIFAYMFRKRVKVTQ